MCLLILKKVYYLWASLDLFITNKMCGLFGVSCHRLDVLFVCPIECIKAQLLLLRYAWTSLNVVKDELTL